MSDFSVVTADHVRQAIAAIGTGQPHRFGPSRDYDLIWQDGRYPPKAVLGVAYKIATGSEAPNFNGGVGSGGANTILRDLGFEIVKKEGAPVADEDKTLEEALKDFNRQAQQADVALAEKERKEVTQRYPLDQWPILPLERYALGLGDKHNSFCWWMEFGTPHAGRMGGGSSRKHIIYRQYDGQWFFDREQFKTEQEAWQAVRAGFVDAFAKAKAGEWSAIDQIEGIDWGPALRTKTLHCYFSTELLPISSVVHIRHFLRLMGQHEEASASHYQVVRLNRLLLDSLRSQPEFNGWNTKELERFLYHWSDPSEKKVIVKIAPGENARFWDDCLTNGYICVGWDEIGDLREYESKDAFDTHFREVCGDYYKGNVSTISKKAKELWMLRELKPGDQIVANKGTSKVLAVGEVIEPGYEYKPERQEYKHVVHVKWDTSYEQDISPQKSWAFSTVANVSQTLSAQILSASKSKPGTAKKVVPVDPLFAEIANALDRKGQIVLYGPPGTGKTYTARRFAVWWMLKRMGQDSPEVLTNKELFNEAEQKLSSAQIKRQVWWAVANPAVWKWDELFRLGRDTYHYGKLQKNYPLVQNGDLVLGYQTMPDARIVALAQVSKPLHMNSSGERQIEIEPLARVENGPTFEAIKADAILAKSEPVRMNTQGTLFAVTEREFERISEMLLENNPSIEKHLNSAGAISSLTRLTFHASYSYEDFIEGFRPVESTDGQLALRLEDGIFKRVCREAQANPAKTYLVLIDEINRANVAKVFGELITLLERDKRGMLISLPQSKEAFTIPPNVYVLGTMNTADRSIKLLDTALRRRFAFLELMPDSSLLRGGKIGNLALDDFLDELNHRIAAKEGREKQIGHSYLLDGDGPVSDPEEFARRFRQEILPLLQEYCYEDYNVLAEYIGEKLVNKENQMLDEDRIADIDRLVEALEQAFTNSGASQ